MPESNRHQLPSIEALFKQSWELFKACFFKLLTLFGLMIGIYLLTALILAVILVIFGLSVSFRNPSDILATIFSPAVLTSAGLIGVLIVTALTYLNILLQISILKVVYEGKEHNSVIQTIKDSKSLVWPVFLVNLITAFITFGGFMLLVIPGIVFSLLFSFAQYEVIFNQKRGVEALRRSFSLFATDFWGIFGRIMLFVVISLIVTGVTGSLSRTSGPFLIWLVNNALSWFGVAYSLTIYKELTQAHPNLPGKNIKGLVISATVGFVLLLLFFSAGINLFLKYKDSFFGPGLNHYEMDERSGPEMTRWDNPRDMDSMKDFENPEGYQFQDDQQTSVNSN